jgi:hypothetical protein
MDDAVRAYVRGRARRCGLGITGERLADEEKRAKT